MLSFWKWSLHVRLSSVVGGNLFLVFAVLCDYREKAPSLTGTCESKYQANWQY